MQTKEEGVVNLWIDNTAFHSAGRCFEAAGTGEVDISGLLQLASQLVISETIQISTAESEDVNKRSTAIRNVIVNRGHMPPQALILKNVPGSRFKAACNKAADRLGDDFALSPVSRQQKEPRTLHMAVPDL
ncbi:MAG: hypothetical protein WC740_22205, partial [Verrucomicrobiia bacterium]